MIISRTPYRVSLFGGGTDYPTWFSRHGGAVLVSAINKYVYVTLRELPPFFEHKTRAVWSKVELVSNNLDIENPAIRGTLEFFNKLDVGLEIHHQGDLPARSGMGSSSSFIVGLLNAHAAMTGLKRVGDSLDFALSIAKTAVRIEQEFVGDTVGVQDQHAAAIGGLNLLLIEPNGRVQVRKTDRWTASQVQRHLALFFVGFTRHASEIAKVQVKEMGNHELAMYELAEQAVVGHMILQRGGPLTDFPVMLRRAWEIKRSLSPVISNSVLDRICDGLNANGAQASKIIGAGGGGFVLSWVDPSKRNGLIQWATEGKDNAKLMHVPFDFDHLGSQIIFEESAKTGARSR